MLFQRRWPPGSRALFALGVVAAVLSVVMAHSYSSSVDARDPGPLVPAVVADRSIPAGGLIVATDLRVTELPQRMLPEPRALGTAEVIGMRAIGPIGVGEVIVPGRLSPGGPVAALVPEGFRAIVIPSGLPPGTLAQGDHVDVLATHAQGAFYTETVAEAVAVIRIIRPSTTSSFDTAGANEYVALLVSPSDTEALAQAAGSAKLSLAIDPVAAG